MNSIQKRFLLFLIGCIGFRTALVFIAKAISLEYLPFMGYMALLPAIGLTYIYLTGSRKTGGEVFGDKIWWNDLRPLHAIFYFMFAFSAINKQSTAWIYLAVDVIIGLFTFLIHHYREGNFKKAYNN
jgi:hypothetical protein